MAEIAQVADTRHVPGEEIGRQRPLQRQIVQVVVEQQRDIATHRCGRQRLVCRAGAVDDHPAVRRHPVEDAVIDELAVIVQQRGIGGTAGRDLRDVAGGRIVQQRGGVGTDEVDLLQPGNIHQPRLGADGDVIVLKIMVVGPGRPHPVPVFQPGSQGLMALGKGGMAPDIRHREPLRFGIRRRVTDFTTQKQSLTTGTKGVDDGRRARLENAMAHRIMHARR